jgi:tRNA A-37 threonylcarbamoyl transferase component Bud32
MSRDIERETIFPEKIKSNYNIIRLSKLEGGISSNNFYFESLTESGELEKSVITLYHEKSDWWKIDKEIYLRKLVEGNQNILFPKIKATGFSKNGDDNFGFLIREYIEGEDLDMALENRISKNLVINWPTLVQDLGYRLASIHKQEIQYCGLIKSNNQENDNINWKEFIIEEINNQFLFLENYPDHNKSIAEVSLKMILGLKKGLLQRLKTLFSSLESVKDNYLAHGDTRFGNIIVNNRENGELQIASFIDLEWAISGDPEIDISYLESWLYFSRYGEEFTKYKDYFLSGYQKIRQMSPSYAEKRLIYHSLRSLNYLTNVFLHQDHTFLEQNPQYSNYIKKHQNILLHITNGDELTKLGINSLTK